MRHLIAALFIAIVAAFPVAAEEPAEGIEEVIRSQLDAFNARDIAAAWTHASPMIQSMFGSPGNFGLMVEQGYPMVWTNDGARFVELREIDGRLWQKVLVVDAAGGGHLLDYQMIELDGVWRIDGVQYLAMPELSA